MNCRFNKQKRLNKNYGSISKKLHNMLLNYLIVAVTHKKRIYLKVTMVHNTYTDQKPTDDKTGYTLATKLITKLVTKCITNLAT